jgi:hypothetical protein
MTAIVQRYRDDYVLEFQQHHGADQRIFVARKIPRTIEMVGVVAAVLDRAAAIRHRPGLQPADWAVDRALIRRPGRCSGDARERSQA